MRVSVAVASLLFGATMAVGACDTSEPTPAPQPGPSQSPTLPDPPAPPPAAPPPAAPPAEPQETTTAPADEGTVVPPQDDSGLYEGPEWEGEGLPPGEHPSDSNYYEDYDGYDDSAPQYLQPGPDCAGGLEPGTVYCENDGQTYQGPTEVPVPDVGQW
jgi:hypothetical protein